VAGLALAVSVKGKPPQIDDAAITSTDNPPLLSSFGFFNGGADRPASALLPYNLRTPLFTDYAEKQRFLYLPKGEKFTVDPDGRLIFPVGSALIKSFGYPMLRASSTSSKPDYCCTADGWVALPYVWKTDGSDAELKVAGCANPPAIFKKPDGTQMRSAMPFPTRTSASNAIRPKTA
jgi:hypothetical protein